MTTATLKNGKQVIVTINKYEEQSVDESLCGLLVSVEEKHVPVTINQHDIVEDSKEIDAAFANTNTGVTFADVASLPATSAVSKFSLKLSPAQINHVEKTKTTVNLPESWTEAETGDTYTVKGNQHLAIKAGQPYTAEEVEARLGFMPEGGRVNYRGQEATYKVTGPQEPETPVVEEYKVTFVETNGVDLAEATIEVKDSEGKVVNDLTKVKSGAYTYTINLDGYVVLTGEFTVENADTEVKITLVAEKEDPVVEEDPAVKELSALIAKAEGLHAEYYTDASWESLKESLEKAKFVRDNPEATNEEVTDAITVLEGAINTLQIAVKIEANYSYLDHYQFSSLHTVEHVKAMGEKYTWLEKGNEKIHGKCIYKVTLNSNPEKVLDLNMPLEVGETYTLTVYLEELKEELTPYTKQFTVKKGEASLGSDQISLSLRNPYKEFKTVEKLKDEIAVHVTIDGQKVENLSANHYKVVKNQGDSEEITDADLTSGEHDFFVLTGDGQYLPFKLTVQNVVEIELKVKEGAVLTSGYANSKIHPGLMVDLGSGWEEFQNVESKMSYCSIYQKGKYSSWGYTEFIYAGQYNITLTMGSKDYNTVYVSNPIDIVVIE